jgi:hypothetical protein
MIPFFYSEGVLCFLCFFWIWLYSTDMTSQTSLVTINFGKFYKPAGRLLFLTYVFILEKPNYWSGDQLF